MAQDIAERIVWLGHDAFRIDGSRTVYFDPYDISAGPNADLILITHEHFDHCSPEDVKRVQADHTVLVAEPDSSRKLSGDVRVVHPGDRLEVQGVVIHAVPSYNVDKAFHPREKGWVGYILEMDGARIYHAGDTDLIPEMKDLDVDIALLPVSGTYVMNWEQAVKAAEVLHPALAIPMHYGTVVGDDQDALHFKDALEGRVEVRILPRA